MMQTCIFETFVGDPIRMDLDPKVFKMWLTGYTVTEVFERQCHEVLTMLEQVDSHDDEGLARIQRLEQCTIADITNQFTILEMLEHFLRKPSLFYDNLCTVQLTPLQQELLIEGYYSFDPEFMKLIVGKKLSKMKKDLEEVCEKTGTRMRSATRQLDNLAHVLKCRKHSLATAAIEAEEKEERGEGELEGAEKTQMPVWKLYRKYFLFPEHFAQQYSRMVFLNRYRFQTTKKRLKLCSFVDFDSFASVLIREWGPQRQGVVDEEEEKLDNEYFLSFGNLTRKPPYDLGKSYSQQRFETPVPPQDNPEPGIELKHDHHTEDSLDQQFIDQLRNLKVLLYADKKTVEDYFTQFIQKIRNDTRFRPSQRTAFSKNRFISLIKGLLIVASNVPSTKQLGVRKFTLFNDVLEEVVKQLIKINLNGVEVEQVFAALISSFKVGRANRQTVKLWVRFLAGITTICTVLYCRVADPGAAVIARHTQESPFLKEIHEWLISDSIVHGEGDDAD